MAKLQMSLPDFTYTSLPGNHIRMSTILAGPDGSRLGIRLQMIDVHNLPSYRALSYCWGEGSMGEECSCEDETSSGRLWLSNNLWQALKQIRRSEEDVPLWVDQLCIDQRNNEEKAQQVRLMGQIYSKASQVVVWLGLADNETALAFHLIESVGEQVVEQVQKMGTDVAGNFIRECYPLDLSSADSPEWIAFRNLFKRPWFSRLWIFQEVVLAQKALFVCGKFSQSLRALTAICESVKAVDRQVPDHQSHIKEVDEFLSFVWFCQMIKSDQWGAASTRQDGSFHLDLLNLMKRLMGQKSSLPHDFVYALLGIAKDVQALSIPIDYTQTFRDLFVYMSKSFVKNYCDLTVLSLVSIGPSDTIPRAGPRTLPSWVPDYRYAIGNNNRRVSGGSRIVKHGRNRHYNSTGSSRESAILGSSHILVVNGIFVGKIDLLSDPDNNMEDEASIGLNVVSGGQWSRMAERCAYGGLYAPTGEAIKQAFARLRVTDYLPGEHDAADRAARVHPFDIPEPGPSAIIRTPNGERLLDTKLEDGVTRRILRSTSRQKFFFTDTGYMGLCHQSCVVGDQVWLLMGGHMPFLLRQLKTEPITHHFKGESYVHGIMDGELLLERFCRDSVQSKKKWLDDLENGLPFDTERLVLA